MSDTKSTYMSTAVPVPVPAPAPLKKKITRPGKSFRLLDCVVFDDVPASTTPSDSGGSSGDETEAAAAPVATEYYEDEDAYYQAMQDRRRAQKAAPVVTAAFVIQMYGINEKGETCSIFVNNYQPFFYILVGDRWTQRNCDMLRKELEQKLGNRQSQASIVKVELVEYNKLYGFTAGKKSKFARIVFKNMATMARTKGLWYEWIEGPAGGSDDRIRKLKPLYSQNVRLELYESNLPPLLRYFHIHQISPSGWVFIPTNDVRTPAVPVTTCKYEYICGVNQVIPQNQKETRVPYKICSFDIEASSSHGDFPVPIKTYKRLATQMVDVFRLQSSGLTPGREKELVGRIVLAAFGHGQFSDIDLVYPKGKTPSKKTLTETLIPKLLAYACAAGELGRGDPGAGASIEAVFERLREATAGGGAGGRGGGDDDGDGDDDAGDGGEGDLELEVVDPDDEDMGLGLGLGAHHSKSKNAVSGNQIKTPVAKKGNAMTTKTSGSMGEVGAAAGPGDITILDILKHDQYTRDDKIQWINTAFCDREATGFPPLEGDKVTFIGSTFLRYGEPEPYRNHCIVLNTCDPVPGCEIETTDREDDLLLRWTRLIQTENPDIIIGYNIFGFDYEFMFRRAQENHCDQAFLELSRKPGQVQLGKHDTPVVGLDNTKIVLATGEYDLRYPKMPGRLQIDMYTYFRRDFNLASYKLDDVAGQYIGDDVKKVEFVTDTTTGAAVTHLYTNNITGLHAGDYIHIEISGFTSDYYRDGHKFPVVAVVPADAGSPGKQIVVLEGHETDLLTAGKSVRWCIAKDDVSPQDIFRLTNGTAADRAKVAKYCIQDCNLVHHLMNKIDVITGYVEMARICSVPISFLVLRGQGIKLTSYVSKKCREKNTLMPDLEKTYDGDGYEGAIVLPPKCAMYMDNPVACLDYASLYPSSMISNNLSPDSKVWTKEYDSRGNLVREWGEKDPKTGEFVYDNLEHLGYKYIDIEFDLFKWRRNPEKPRAKAEKVKEGKKVCRWVQLPHHQKSIMPAILEELLKARADTRKQIKTISDPFMQNILDKRQLGYKVTANSLYGQCGAKTSTFFEKDVAASTTATGRMMITYAKRIIEEVYGDLEYSTAEHGNVKCCAEYVYGDSVASYTPITIRVGRCVYICTIEEVASRYGLGKWVVQGGGVGGAGEDPKEFCELNLIPVESWTEQGWTRIYRVIRHRLAPHKRMVRITTQTGLVDVTDDHSLLTAHGQPVSPRDVTLGTELLHFPIRLTRQGGGSEILSETIMLLKNPIYLQERTYTFDDRSTTMVEIAEHYLAMTQLGFQVEIESDATTQAVYLHCRGRSAAPVPPSSIQKMEYIRYDGGFVYDLTTENHHFAAGVGNMIVHNTDSVFFTFNLKDPKNGENIRGKKALEITIEIAQDAAKLCTQWLKPPMELSYEKTLMPFILLSKKRYVGMLYETDPNKGKMKYMGLSLKRRDSCDYLKDVYGGILTILMKGGDGQNIQRAVEFLDNSLKELIQGNVSMDKLAITKALRGHYKNPQQIAHAVLAERIAKRDPGNKPKPGDRMKFVHIVSKDTKALQGDKIETPEFIVQNRVPIDYSFYITNQLMKPLQQLFGLALEQICAFKHKQVMIRTIRKDVKDIERDYGDSIEVFMKKREKYCSAQVKKLIFEKYLIDIQNQKNGMQSIHASFGGLLR